MPTITSNENKLAALFKKFAGKPLEGVFSHEGSPVLREMVADAKKEGLQLRLIFPGTQDRNDWTTKSDRVTVYARREPSGLFFVGGMELR